MVRVKIILYKMGWEYYDLTKERCQRKQSKGERDSSSSLLGDMKYTIKDSLLYRALSKNEICERYLFIFGYLFLYERNYIVCLRKKIYCHVQLHPI